MNEEEDLMNAQITSMNFWNNDVDDIWNNWGKKARENLEND